MHPILFITNITLTVVLSFLFSGIFIRHLTDKDIEECNRLDEEHIELMAIKLFPYTYLDDLVQLEQIGNNVSDEDYIELDVPKNKIKMYHRDGCFVYYTRNGDVPYKYVNVACRKFVIDYNCRQLYTDDDIYEAIEYHLDKDVEETKEEETKEEETKVEETKEEETKVDSCFVSKKKSKKELEREKKVEKSINKCIWKGSIPDKIDVPVDNNNLSFVDFIRSRRSLKVD